MRNRTKILIIVILIIALLMNAFAYASIINGSGTIINLIKRVNLAYITPRGFSNQGDILQKKPQSENDITKKSYDFVTAAFARDDASIKKLMDSSTTYIRSKDGSSFIRYVENGVLVEGYMATDKKLINAKLKWYVEQSDHTIICSMEVYIEGIKSPELWYIHYRKVKDDWKIYMLENNI